MQERKSPPTPVPTVFDRIGGFVDRVVSVFAPERGMERMKARRLQNALRVREARNAYIEAGEHTSTRDGKWIGSRLSPNSGLEADLETTRLRARELYLNDSIGGVVETRVNLVIGTGFTPQARIKERPGLITAEQAKAWNLELEEIYERTACRIGKDGKSSLWQLSRLIERHHGVDGESFTILSDRGDADKPIPLTLEVVDPTRVETPPSLVGNKLVRLGVEHDESGRIVAYHVRNSHPGDTIDVDIAYTRYAAERVLHVFEPWFAGQIRAFPWLTRALNRLKDAKDLDEAAIIAAQVEACYAAFIENSDQAAPTAADAAATNKTRREEELRPGLIRYLDPLEKVSFSNPTKSNGYGPLQESNYRRVAAAINFPYEMVIKNWTGLSFAAGRLSLTDVKLSTESEQELVRVIWLVKIWERMTAESVIVGASTIPARLYNRAPWLFQAHDWTAQAWQFSISPKEDIETDVIAVNNNFRTRASVCSSRYGTDDEETQAERQQECESQRTRRIEPAAADVASQTLEQQSNQQEKLQGAVA